jgi:hypothetical protein
MQDGKWPHENNYYNPRYLGCAIRFRNQAQPIRGSKTVIALYWLDTMWHQ